MMELKMGIEFTEESFEQLDLLISKVKELKELVDSLNLNETLGYVNNITINTPGFIGNEQDVIDFGDKLVQCINDEKNRR